MRSHVRLRQDRVSLLGPLHAMARSKTSALQDRPVLVGGAGRAVSQRARAHAGTGHGRRGWDREIRRDQARLGPQGHPVRAACARPA
eukprot:10879601-Alexandrium_andersonii.AAC.1